jgi:lipopolysaccharide export system protein LptA
MSGTSSALGPQTSTATAAKAEYDGANDALTLTGKPIFRDDSLEMTAERFVVERAAGNMLATGSVQTTVRSSHSSGPGGLLSGDQPTHVIARQAQVLHNSQKAIFTGEARLWQGSNSVEAPVIELSQKMQTLAAYGKGSCTQCVHTTFVGQGALDQLAEPMQPNSASAADVTTGDTHPGSSTFRVLSQRLLYSDAERKATFSEHVEAISSSGNVFADQAEVFLTAASPRFQQTRGSASMVKEKNVSHHGNDSPQSSVEKIVATGHVVVEQQGRRGTGTRLVYTASDGLFVLTGDSANPPQVVDSIHGTVTGQVLTFSSQTQAIIVNGSPNDAAVTNTRVRKK